MFALDLFNNDHERRLAEGAVDTLEQRRIDDLAMKMDDLVARARTATTPEVKAALMKEFQKCKAERDSYYKIREGGIPGNVPTEKIPGKEDLLKGKGRSYYEAAQKKNSEEIEEHGGGIGPKQHWQDLMQENKLSVGDPIIVTAPNEFEGKTGEIAELSPSGKFVIVNLYNHGEQPMHLSDVEYNQYAADQEDEDDWYDDGAEDTLEDQGNGQVAAKAADDAVVDTMSGMAEGFQDFNKVEPYAVCLAGKPVKRFDYYEQARRFHDNWKQKLYREGNKEKADKVTLMPLNLDEANGDLVQVTSDDQTETYRYKGWQFIETANDYYSGEAWLVDPDSNKEWFSYQTDDKHGIRKYYNDQDQLAFSLSARDEGQSTEKWLKAQASNWKDTWHAQPNAPVVHEQGIAEAEGRVDPILLKALKRMPDGLATHRQVLDAAYDAYAMEKGYLAMKGNHGVTDVYIPKLMGLYKDKHGLTFNEASSPAQQAAIAISKKKEVNEFAPSPERDDDEVPDQILKLANRWWNATDDQPKITNVLRSLGWSIAQVESEDDAVQMQHDDGTTYFISADDFDPDVFEAQTDYQKRRQRERNVDAGKPVARQRQSKMTDYQKRRAQDRKDMALGEDQDTSGVESAIIRRIMVAHTDLLKQFGPEKVMQAAEEVAYNVGDVDEIGTSDVSAYVHQVKQILGAV